MYIYTHIHTFGLRWGSMKPVPFVVLYPAPVKAPLTGPNNPCCSKTAASAHRLRGELLLK